MPSAQFELRPHRRALPLKVGTRRSRLARAQTAIFLARLREVCPALHGVEVFEEHVIDTTGDVVQDRALAEIGGKGLFAKEIHEALATGRVDFAVHSLKDLETVLPPGITLACVLPREDCRDALILPAGRPAPDPAAPYAALAPGALVATASVRRQAQLKNARPDLRFALIRGNVGTRLARIDAGGIALADRLAALDGAGRTPPGGHARLLEGDVLHLTGLVARADGSFLLRRVSTGPRGEAARLGQELGAALKADSPADIFAP